MIEPENSQIPVSKQCELIGLNRSSLYYEPQGESEYNLYLMRLIDAIYTKAPFYGCPKITKELNRWGYPVNHKRIRRLMRLLGLEAIVPKKNLSKRGKGHKIYPYLLKNIKIDCPNQVWATDITYIRMARGFVYLVAVMDWHSRYVLSWEVSLTIDTEFCQHALSNALKTGKPEIFNTDQGSQFTADAFTGILKANDIKISMDGRGSFFDNIFVERLWRSVKYEEVYQKEYEDVWDAEENISNYFKFYNTERIHQSLDYRTPEEVYLGKSYPNQMLIEGIENHLKGTEILSKGWG